MNEILNHILRLERMILDQNFQPTTDSHQLEQLQQKLDHVNQELMHVRKELSHVNQELTKMGRELTEKNQKLAHANQKLLQLERDKLQKDKLYFDPDLYKQELLREFYQPNQFYQYPKYQTLPYVPSIGHIYRERSPYHPYTTTTSPNLINPNSTISTDVTISVGSSSDCIALNGLTGSSDSNNIYRTNDL